MHGLLSAGKSYARYKKLPFWRRKRGALRLKVFFLLSVERRDPDSRPIRGRGRNLHLGCHLKGSFFLNKKKWRIDKLGYYGIFQKLCPLHDEAVLFSPIVTLRCTRFIVI